MEQVLEQFADVRPVPTATPGAQAWTARDLLPGGGERAVLVKRLPDLPDGRARATHALALAHPAIVPTRRWLRDSGEFYVVRDFVPGQNLHTLLADAARRAFDRLLTLLSPVLDAVEYARDAGLPHGAVSSENVLIAPDGRTLLSDFGPIRHGSVFPTAPADAPRADLWAVCELFKTFLPTRPRDDDAGQKARARLLKNLTDAQDRADTPAALRDKLDAIGQMADLLGFSSRAETGGKRVGPRLLWAVQPSVVTLPPGGGAGLALSLSNTGDADLAIDAMASDAVWINPYERFVPFTLSPAARRDLVWAASGARLTPGRYEPRLLVQAGGEEYAVTVPVVVTGDIEAPPAAPSDQEREEVRPAADHPGIAVTQDPDPAVVALGSNTVVHLGVANIGATRIRLDKISTSPAWLAYPGGFGGLWIEPGRTEYLGFSVVGANLPGGDFTAHVTFAVSVLTETLVGMEPVRRDMTCDVRVRVVRGASDAKAVLDRAARGPGCVPGAAAGLLLLGALVLLRRM